MVVSMLIWSSSKHSDMKVEMTLTIEIDLPEDITREDVQQSMNNTTGLWLAHIEKSVAATVNAVDLKELI